MNTWNPLADAVLSLLTDAVQDGPLLRASLIDTARTETPVIDGKPLEVTRECTLSICTPGCRDEIPFRSGSPGVDDPARAAMWTVDLAMRHARQNATHEAGAEWVSMQRGLLSLLQCLRALKVPNENEDMRTLVLGLPTPSVETIQRHCQAGGLWRIVDRRQCIPVGTDMVHESGALHLRRVLEDPGDRDRWWPLTREGIITPPYTSSRTP